MTKIFNFIRGLFKFPILEKMVLWFTVDQYYSKWHKFFVPNNYQYEKGSFRYFNRNNIKLNLDISDLMDWYIYFGFKEIEKEKFYSTIRKGDIILDVGANLGQITLFSAQRTGHQGKVLSIEPDSENFKKLSNNIKLNSLPFIETFNLALSDKSGMGKIIIRDENNHGMNRISQEGENGDISIFTLDELFLSTNNRISHIKIDTEGFEYRILKGGIGLIKKFRPILYIEIIDANLKHHLVTPNDIFNLLIELNYSIFRADTGEKLNLNGNYTGCQLDIIAKPNQN